MKLLQSYKIATEQYQARLAGWALNRLPGLFIYNLTLMILVLLHSAGYFDPYFKITINVVVVLSLILAIFLLGLKSKAVFVIGLLFWIFAAALRILSVEVWAERTAVYAFDALVIGLVLVFFNKY